MARSQSMTRPQIVQRTRGDYAALAALLGATAVSGVLGSRFTPGPQHPRTRRWYARLEKSPLNPPPAVFGPVWTTLYALIAVAGWRVYRAPRSRSRTLALGWWTAQMAFNAAWSPIFFGARNAELAMADLVATFASIGAFIEAARPVDRRAAQLMLPYAAWVAFAGYLNAEVVRRNR